MRVLPVVLSATMMVAAGCTTPIAGGDDTRPLDVPPWVQGTPGVAELRFDGGVAPFTCALAPATALPSWLTLNNCTLAGQAPLLAPGSTRSVLPPFTVTITDNARVPVTGNFSISIQVIPDTPHLAPVAGATCIVDTPCLAVVATAAGGLPPHHFQSDTFREGTPPFGTVVGIDGAMTGQAGTLGVYVFGVCVSDLVAASDCAPVTLTIIPVPGGGDDTDDQDDHEDDSDDQDQDPYHSAEDPGDQEEDVSAALPDLVASDIFLNEEEFVAGTIATFTFVVENRGEADAPRFIVRFELDGAPYADIVFDGGLAAGAIGEATATWTATEGTHAMRAIADPANEVAEWEETNNELGGPFTVEAPAPPADPPFGSITVSSVTCTFVKWYYSDAGSEYQRGYQTEWTVDAAGTMSANQPRSYVSVIHQGYHIDVSHAYTWTWTGGSYFSTQDNSQYRTVDDPVDGTWSLHGTFIVGRGDSDGMAAQRLNLDVTVPSSPAGKLYSKNTKVSMGCPPPPEAQDGSFFT